MPEKPRRASKPAPRAGGWRGLAVAGMAATLVSDLVGRTLSPLLGLALPGFGEAFDPRPIGEQALAAAAGLDPYIVETLGFGEALHVGLGVAAFPALWARAARPALARIAPRLGTLGAAIAFGVLLWAASLWGAAHLLAGNPPFLGWTSLAWVALWVHLAYALVLARLAP